MLWVVLAGCGSTAATGSSAPPPATSTVPEPSTAEPPPPPPGAPYELHEWGVVDVPESGAVEIAAGAGEPQRPVSVRKPVVYAHLLDGTTEQAFGLRVALGAGSSFVEHFPPATVEGTTLEWPQIVARPGPCGTAPAAAADLSAARRMTRGSCGSADGVCEVDELPRYDAASAACLGVGDASTGLLFYRGSAPSVTLPLEATRAADLTVTVTARGALDGVPGGILRISTAMSGPWPAGRVVVSRADAPAVGASVVMPVGSEELTRAQGIAELTRDLVLLGLTEDEAAAFVHGWGDELFGRDTTVARDTTREAALDGVGPRRQDVLLFFLPPSAIDGITSLTATPAPRALHRAFLVRIDLGAVTTG